MIRNQKIKGTFICGPLLFKWINVFQSWLDCFSIGVWAFMQNINFLSSVVLVYGVHLLQFLDALICSLIALFPRAWSCIRYCPNSLQKILNKHWILIPLEEIIQIWIIPSPPKILIYSTYTRFIVENRDNVWCNKKVELFGTTFLKKISYLGFF